MVVNHEDAYSGRGRSDLIACVHGHFIALEVKRPGGKPTPPQLRFIEKVKRAGGYGTVVHSVQEALRAVQPFQFFSDQPELEQPHRQNGRHQEDAQPSPTGNAVDRIEAACGRIEIAVRMLAEAMHESATIANRVLGEPVEVVPETPKRRGRAPKVSPDAS